MIIHRISQTISQQWKYCYYLSEFYGAIAGFLVLQLGAWYLARMAADHGVLGDAVTRGCFFLIQCLLLLIFENKLHLFQYKHVWIILVNGCLVLLSTQMNPIFTFIGWQILCYPSFKREEEELSEFVAESFSEDEKMWFVTNPNAMKKK